MQTPNSTVRASTVVGLSVMDALDKHGGSVCIMAHGIPDSEREHVLGELVARGGYRDDHPSNNDARGVRLGDLSVTLWGDR